MKNEIAFRMLQESPKSLICTPEYQESIQKIVRRFKSKGGFKRESIADIVQDINTQLFTNKLACIQRNYNPQYGLLKQYFERTVYNIAIELVNASNKRKEVSYDLDQINPQYLSRAGEDQNDLMTNELKTLQVFFKTEKRKAAKLWLLLKLYSRSVITPQDIKNYHPVASNKVIAETLKIFGGNYATFDDNVLYSKISSLINQAEGKKNSADALRKWLSSRLNDLNSWMNQRSSFTYDNEALRNLMQVFFMHHQEKTLY
ncbi:hypothetical protein [uncultured Microscilla sp.]|uniref:hypothetical protein n=1 Tax=uncultured Microscilla sp. TaxID=432653 RepID=UPI002613E475|nr:hypothetical protein [uncultured Microscilla sp.]